MTAERFAWLAAVVCGALCVLVVVLLVVARVVRDRRDERRRRTRAPIWNQVLVLTIGDEDEVEAATLALLRTSPAQRRAVLDDAFALVPKLRGDARTRLRQLLQDWGALRQAERLAVSGSVVRRCRGIYQLGILADPGSEALLVRGLADGEFAVRRSAMLALTAYSGDAVVSALLAAASGDVRLRHDFLATVDRIGGSAVPVLETALAEPDIDSPVDQRRQFLAAEALGLVGGHTAVPTLEAALTSPSLDLVVACVNALGDLGSPSSVMALAGLLDHESVEVRRTTADSLGMIGGPGSVAFLAAALRDPQVEVTRSAAQALERCGEAGRRALEASAAHPVVREILALSRLVGAHA